MEYNDPDDLKAEIKSIYQLGSESNLSDKHIGFFLFIYIIKY